MYGRLQDLGPQFALIIKNMNELAKNYHEATTDEKRGEIEARFIEEKAQLDEKLNELDTIRERKNTVLHIGVGTAGIGDILTGVFEAKAMGSDTARLFTKVD